MQPLNAWGAGGFYIFQKVDGTRIMKPMPLALLNVVIVTLFVIRRTEVNVPVCAPYPGA